MDNGSVVNPSPSFTPPPTKSKISGGTAYVVSDKYKATRACGSPVSWSREWEGLVMFSISIFKKKYYYVILIPIIPVSFT